MKSKNYADGGFLDDGANVDGVSGNEVPTGSLAAEVRDDIPAQLSEGEFVVPADVVRFIGLDKLMKMRDQAKTGLARMEEEGQIGGSSTPMEDSGLDEASEMDAMIDGMDNDEDFDGALQNFAEGGSVRARRKLPSYKDFTGREFGKAELIKYITYVNADGETVEIKFINGQPMQPIPEGYYPQGNVPDGGEEEVPDAISGEDGGGSVVGKNDPNNPWKGITAPGDTDAIKQHHQIKSDKVTKYRKDNISDLINAATQNGEADLEHDDLKYLSSLMTEDGMELYIRRFENSKGLDKVLTKGKTKAELMQLAQTTADTIRRQSGLPDPSYTGKPTGEMPDILGDIKDMMSGGMDMDSVIKKVAVLGMGLVVGIPPVIIKVIADKFDVEEDEVAVKVAAETTKTSEEVTPVVAPVVPPILAQEVPDRDPKLLGEITTEDAPAGSVTAEDLNTVADANLDITAESEGATVTNFLGEEVTSDATEVPIVGEDSINSDLYSEDRLRILEAMDEEEALLDSTGSETGILADLGITGEENKEIDQAQAIQRISTKLGLSLDFVTRAIQADKVATGTEGNMDFEQVAQGTADRLAKIEMMKAQQAKDKEAAKAYASKVAADRAKALAAQATQVNGAKVEKERLAEEQRLAAIEDARVIKVAKQQEADKTAAAAYAKKVADDRAAYLAQEAAAPELAADKAAANIATAAEQDAALEAQEAAMLAESARLTEATKALADKAAADRALKDQQRRQQSQTNTGGSNNKPSSTPTHNPNYSQSAQRAKAAKNTTKDRSNRGYSWGLAKGGLVSTDKPIIKKMPKDNTQGLASKKKAKQKAQAKKGALAAKRT